MFAYKQTLKISSWYNNKNANNNMATILYVTKN